jgi:hypothetical protein
MRSTTNRDATAGERARAIRADPAGARRVLDATDPRYGKLGARPRARDPESVLDHSDPQYREPADLAA